MVKTNTKGLFKQHARERNLIRAENRVHCSHSNFLGPAYTVRKTMNVRAYR